MLRRLPYFLLPAVLLALLVGMWAGLVRLGWVGLATPLVGPLAHGPLMVSGFLGTLIALERAVALRTGWGFLAPLLSGVGMVVLMVGGKGGYAAATFALSALLFLIVNLAILRHQPALHTFTLLLGSLAWLVGNLLWLTGWPFYQIAWWWAVFLVLTIAGERLELSRVRRLTRQAHQLFGLALSLVGLGLTLSLFQYGTGARLTGVGLLALALWLIRFDIARFTVRKQGVTRYIALCLLSGYIWLAVAGILGVTFGGVMAGMRYDALLHALFLGFVFSMIFGHAPIILPALTGIQIHFAPRFYAPLILLHLSLLLRVLSDLTGWFGGRQWGGMLNVIVILLFLGNTVGSMKHGNN